MNGPRRQSERGSLASGVDERWCAGLLNAPRRLRRGVVVSNGKRRQRPRRGRQNQRQGRQCGKTGDQMTVAAMVELQGAQLAARVAGGMGMCGWLRAVAGIGCMIAMPVMGMCMLRVLLMLNLQLGGSDPRLGSLLVQLGAPLADRRADEQHGNGKDAQPAAPSVDPASLHARSPCHHRHIIA